MPVTSAAGAHWSRLRVARRRRPLARARVAATLRSCFGPFNTPFTISAFRSCVHNGRSECRDTAIRTKTKASPGIGWKMASERGKTDYSPFTLNPACVFRDGKTGMIGADQRTVCEQSADRVPVIPGALVAKPRTRRAYGCHDPAQPRTRQRSKPCQRSVEVRPREP